MEGGWQFWIDRGGTFTDCMGLGPTGELRVAKVLSGEGSPLRGIRALVGLEEGQAIAPCTLRMGTTIATNALLERQGEATALIVNKGFADLLEIGNQQRSDLFALDIVKPESLYREVYEVDGRQDAEGQVIQALDPDDVRMALQGMWERGIRSLAVALIHAHRDSSMEEAIFDIAQAIGFEDVCLSSVVSGEEGLLGRGDTTVADAYLTPLLRRYLASLASELPGSSVLVMQSSGGLTGIERFRGKDAVLSGPAGGVVAYSTIAKACGENMAIGFDMGGTSTDVSAFDGDFERSYENEIAGVRLRASMLRIHTVAAGGGSVCRDNGFRLTVGPESAGARPGPLCYGDPSADELTLTDCNLALGRVWGKHFPMKLDSSRAFEALEKTREGLAHRGVFMSCEEVAGGFLQIANESMSTAIREVTMGRGKDPREFALVVFGGAAGQHACAVAESLGVETIISHPYAGVLSALGMGLSQLSWNGQHNGQGVAPSELSSYERVFSKMESEGKTALRRDGAESWETTRRVDLRYRGSDSTITLELRDEIEKHFVEEHLARYGFERDAPIEVVTLRVEVTEKQRPSNFDVGNARDEGMAREPRAISTQRIYLHGEHREVGVFERSMSLGSIAGPALLVDATSTLIIEEGWFCDVDEKGVARVKQEKVRTRPSNESLDPVRLEVYNHLFSSIARQMGHVLANTAMSTNIRERLDFSCAIFDAEGGLVANAPHIPVHLGAMSESIKGLLHLHPDPRPGDVYATNDPTLGGSHLPDITVIQPVHDEKGARLLFVASRGHHAEIGGIQPGSMPPFSSRLLEEGVCLRAELIVREGRFLEEKVRRLLSEGSYPSRNPDENLADLRAQIAANRAGQSQLLSLILDRGRNEVLAYMQHIQDNAADEVARALSELGAGVYSFSDGLDDGTPIEVRAVIADDRFEVDFSGSGGEHEGNLNAPKAVTVAALMYVLRCLVGRPIPLNSGCVRTLALHIPEGSLLAPGPERAVVAGNVETSQRVVDVLLGALGMAAASQGTMNNLSFGNNRFGYYETLAGGAGATPKSSGASAVHTHMTNTRVTDAEILEQKYPVRVLRFGIRRGSGGAGAHKGGDGLVRELEFLEAMRASIISERRETSPFGLAGGQPGARGRNFLNGELVGSKVALELEVGDVLCIETPGGGGYGQVGDETVS